MSHGKERSEKVCLNCNSGVYGRYCHVCGQENTEPRETFWGLVTHFFNDITHFDGKFFTTVKHLIRKPGYLPLMYISGKRATYLNPVRMYVFSSAFFFFIFFWFYNVKSLDIGKDFEIKIDTAGTVINDQLFVDSLSGPGKEIVEKSISDFQKLRQPDSLKNSSKNKTAEQYREEQARLPEAERDGWLKQKVNERAYQINTSFRQDPRSTILSLTDKFLHSFPYILFVSLPLFAVFLKLLYSRKYYFTDHIMFLIFLYIFTFLVFIVMIIFSQLENLTGLNIFNWMNFFLILAGIYYAYKSMRTFYMQGRGTTISKFILFNFMSFILISILFVIFLIITLLRI